MEASKAAEGRRHDIDEVRVADWRMENSGEPFDVKSAESYLAENIDRMAEGLLLRSLLEDE